ncbi:MAG: hypothetical protein HY287_15730 [Planctomycetes bacterium]|nr:hypothetical protein [Planctomycetota bacterium]MBI3835776.1 hypothetical protein [Planctomycetota bacterium]
MKSMIRIPGRGNGEGSREAKQVSEAEGMVAKLNVRVELIQALIPLGLEAVEHTLQREVTALAGERYVRGGGQAGHARWGTQAGSVYLSDQRVSIEVPRVRDTLRNQEIPLATYQSLRAPRRAEEAALRKVLNGLSCRATP